MNLIQIVSILPFCLLVCSAEENNCSLLSQLEYALYNTDSNERQLNEAFFPPRKATSRYINVIYKFRNEMGRDDDGCSVTFIWGIGGFLLIQPPTIFELTSLLFSYPANDIKNMTITLPYDCRILISVSNDTDGDGNVKCSCLNMANSNLDILTQQIMQYSKFNNEAQIVRDEKSTAQSICFNNLENGFYNKNASINMYLSAILILPVITVCVSSSIIWTYDKHIEKIANHPASRANIVGTFLTGVHVTIFIFAVDVASVYYYVTKNNEYGDITIEPYSIQWTFATLIVECVISGLALLVIFQHPYYFQYFELKQYLENNLVPYKPWVPKVLCLTIFIIVLIFIPLFFLGFFIILCLLFSISVLYNMLLRVVNRITLPSLIQRKCSCLRINFLPFFSLIILLPFFLLPPVSLLFGIFLASHSPRRMIYSSIVPVIFVSAHFLYICAAWLTEPSKTTSVAILALAIIFLLFIMHRSLYNFLKEIIDTYFGNTDKDSTTTEWIPLLGTIILGALGVFLIAFYVAAFFSLPLPTVKLADYLENIVQVILVFLAALISYKFISFQDSDAKKFFKKFNQSYRAGKEFEDKFKKTGNKFEDEFEEAGLKCGNIASKLVPKLRRNSI